MANEFDIPNSENAAALQNLLGATNELENPISRNAKILHNILGEQHEIEEPVGNIGKLLKQILEQGIGGGLKGGYTVKFKVNGSDYYIASCLQGKSITEPPTPTVEGVFMSWQLNGADVTFPFTPSANVELVANFATVHTEIEVSNASEQLYSYSGGTVKKSNSGMALFGYVSYETTQKFLFLVSQTQNAVTMNDNQMSTGNITYNGETWYYAHSRATTTTEIIHEAANVGTFEGSQGAPDISKRILDYYFNVS